MKTTTALLVAGSIAALSSPAMAQDADDNFTGPRVEALAGYDVSKAGSTTDNDGNPNDDQSIDGVAYGIGAGYDFNAGGVVLGVEAELTDSSAKTDFEDGDFEGFGLGNVGAGRDIYVGGRIGVLASPDLLVYAKGGYTNGRYDMEFDDGTGNMDRANIDTDGYRVGAGVEYALSGNSFAKIEYRYSNYGSAEVDFEGDAPDVDLGDIDVDRHQVMAGFGYRF